MPRARLWWFMAALLTAAAGEACGGGGDTSSATSSGGGSSSSSSGSGGAGVSSSSSSSASSSTGGMGGSGGMAPFALTSPSLTEGATFATTYTCAGANISPALQWTAGPPSTQSYAVVFTDLSNALIHWVIWDIPAATLALPENVENAYQPQAPAGAKQTLSYDNQTRGYLGPCPPATHTYQFKVYALDVATLPNAGMNSTRPQVEAEILNHDIASASLSGKGDPP